MAFQMNKLRDTTEVMLVDGIRYYLVDFKEQEYDENYLENAVFSNYELIFGINTILINKYKIESIAGTAKIPDAFVIDLENKKWYIVEIELSTHQIDQHILPQISGFLGAISNKSTAANLAGKIYDEIERDRESKGYKLYVNKIDNEKHKFIMDIMTKTEPQIIVIIDEKTEKIRETLDQLKTKPTILLFRIFLRENSPNVFLFQIETLIRHEKVSPDYSKNEFIVTDQKSTTQLTLENLFSVPHKKPEFNKIFFKDGKSFDIRYWKDLFVSTVKWLDSSGFLTPENIEKKIRDSTLRGYVLEAGDERVKSFREGKNAGNFIVETSFNQGTIINLTKRILKEFGINLNEVVLKDVTV